MVAWTSVCACTHSPHVHMCLHVLGRLGRESNSCTKVGGTFRAGGSVEGEQRMVGKEVEGPESPRWISVDARVQGKIFRMALDSSSTLGILGSFLNLSLIDVKYSRHESQCPETLLYASFQQLGL